MDMATSGLVNFRYDHRKLDDWEIEFRISSERLAGQFDALSMTSQKDAVVNLMLSEAIKTSAIEGENLDRDSVRSSLLSLITSRYAVGQRRPEIGRCCFFAGGCSKELARFSDA